MIMEVIGMTTSEVFAKDKTVFNGFDDDKWFRYYSALNREVPVEKVKEKPYYLELTENEKICYNNGLKSLLEERKTFPQASYEVRLRDLDF
jgi:hypothetical protein